MASSTSSFVFKLATFTLCLGILFGTSSSRLTGNFYARTCPNFRSVLTRAVNLAVSSEARMGASLLRLHFHDCFVTANDTANFTGEKGTPPNADSVRGFDVIDTIKTQLESQCAGVVSCADILAAAAHDSVVALGGPRWNLVFGRRDSASANANTANADFSLSGLISAFSKQGLNTNEMVALSGAHTIGQARCTTFRSRLTDDKNINASFATSTRANCPTSGGDNNLSPLDATPTIFDNSYYKDLINQRGLLHSDQELFNGGSTDALVRTYASSQATFFRDFASAMVKMSNLNPLTGSRGQIRINCRRPN